MLPPGKELLKPRVGSAWGGAGGKQCSSAAFFPAPLCRGSASPGRPAWAFAVHSDLRVAKGHLEVSSAFGGDKGNEYGASVDVITYPFQKSRLKLPEDAAGVEERVL